MRLLVGILINGSLDHLELGLHGLDFVPFSLSLLVEKVNARTQSLDL